ncbi:MAG: winged helix-turn-helix transcriptional regulator [Candidatus Omnitrophica bacterium]|nr:winged helix-turn-helix transcriptional regulator [Candidatus Omnitrophota bacterium]
MIEKIVTSKTRVKLLKLFLTNIDDRYYLRELERLLDESLSPLRRQLLKLEKMEILTVEYEANLKYYRLNKNFTGIEELINSVLGPTETPQIVKPEPQIIQESKPNLQPVTGPPRRMKYDLVVLILVSLFVLGTSVFVVYTSRKNIKQIAGLSEAKPQTETDIKDRTLSKPGGPDEMISRRWKVRAGTMPALSSGVAGREKNTEEL